MQRTLILPDIRLLGYRVSGQISALAGYLEFRHFYLEREVRYPRVISYIRPADIKKGDYLLPSVYKLMSVLACMSVNSLGMRPFTSASPAESETQQYDNHHIVSCFYITSFTIWWIRELEPTIGLHRKLWSEPVLWIRNDLFRIRIQL